MQNIPEVKLGIVAVSRDCFPIGLSIKRREAIKKAYKGGLYECPVTVENEKDMLKAVEDVKAAGCNALVVFLGNFGPETPETLIAKNFDGPRMPNVSQSLNFGKSVSDNGWGIFVNMISYKAEMAGKHVIKVDRMYPSSQRCHVCGYLNPITKDLKVREWECPVCGTHHDRDHNAAVNLKTEALRIALLQE